MLGFSWMLYQSDDGRSYAIKVDNDYVNMGERGWSALADPGTIQYPRGWAPRAVIGVASDGRLRWAICATVASSLWSGGTLYFTYRDTNGNFLACTVVGRRRERMLKIPSPDVPLMRPELAAYLASRRAAA